jgi:hypothetical protein
MEGSARAWDLEIEIPGYAYHRLELDVEKDVVVQLKPRDLHVIEEGDEG